jgi:DNA mismatch repair ATPase MutS
LIITGSNMSGKSTILRAVGLNTALALAGAPVRAARIRLSPLALAGSIRVLDSLHGGESRFLAEIRRLRQMVDLTNGQLPLLFLIDEMLHGTNPADRQKGSAAVVQQLLSRNAIGLVTTHDLALTVLGDSPAGGLKNVHFIDHVEDGRLRYDYCMRPGIVPRSNALRLMHEMGLSIGEDGCHVTSD